MAAESPPCNNDQPDCRVIIILKSQIQACDEQGLSARLFAIDGRSFHVSCKRGKKRLYLPERITEEWNGFAREKK